MTHATAWARRRATSAVLASALALALVGCDRLTAALEEKAQEVAEDIVPEEGSAPPTGPVLSEHEQLAAKLALYVECRDRASRRIRQSWQRYDEHVDATDGTPRAKGGKPFLYEIDAELIPCEEAVTKGPAMVPSLPELEKAMAGWLAHAKVFAATTVELDAYYEAEGYAADAWARGKELAPGFLATWQAWSAADEELATLVEARMDVVERALLSELEASRGKDLEWHARNVVLHAKELVRCVDGPSATVAGRTRRDGAGAGAGAGRGRTTKAIAAECKPELASLQDATTDFRAEHEADRQAAEAVFWMSAFEAEVGDFLQEAEAVVGKPGKGGPTPEQIAALVDEHDDLVSDANNLRFRR